MTVGDPGAARPQPDGSDIVEVTETAVAPVAATLARAFYDDPIMSFIFPDDSRRLTLLDRGFALYMRRLWLRHRQCFTTGRTTGAALWLPPDRWKLSWPAQLALLPALLRTYARHVPKLLSFVTAMEEKHPEAPPHHYLAVLGVDPEAQGRGFGAALMAPILRRCDEEGIGAYLEATTPRSRELYSRNGFEVTEELVAVKGSPPMWLMWRDPRPGSG